jgi:hypothetical protein
MEDRKKLQAEKRKKTESTSKEGKSVRKRKLRSANERTNTIREKNSVIIDGDRSAK